MTKWKPIETIATVPLNKRVLVGWREGRDGSVIEITRRELPREHGWTHWYDLPRFPSVPKCPNTRTTPRAPAEI